MPELPEVEYARRALARRLTGATLTAVHVTDRRILDKGVTPAGVSSALTGQRVRSVTRRGKWIRILLDDVRVFSHLGMTGKWLFTIGDDEATNATDVRFEKVRFDVRKNGKRSRAHYIDPRLFGRFVVAEEDVNAFTALGPDPLHDGIDVKTLLEKLARRKKPIKAALLDQTVLAGVGNIQATEALFFARIDPQRRADQLSPREAKALAAAIMKSIRETIAAQRGKSIAYIQDAGGENPFRIYGRKGEPCPRCRKPLRKILLEGRGTVFCAHCQK